MKLLLDMNLPPRWVHFLRIEGIESVHWSDIGAPNATDRDIMIFAQENGYIVFTHDLDFGALLAYTCASGPSVIQVRTQNIFPEAIGSLVLKALRQFGEELQKGALVTIDPNRLRARLLPFRP